MWLLPGLGKVPTFFRMVSKVGFFRFLILGLCSSGF